MGGAVGRLELLDDLPRLLFGFFIPMIDALSASSRCRAKDSDAKER